MDTRQGSCLNPGAIQFQPDVSHPQQHQNGMPSHQGGVQVSPPSLLPALLDRVQSLEHGQESLRGDIEDLRMSHADLSQDLHRLKEGGWSVEVGPFKDAAEFRQKLNLVKVETMEATSGADPNVFQELAKPTSSNGTVSLPPHLRKIHAQGQHDGTTSLPAHPRANSANNALVTDGKVDRLETAPGTLAPTRPLTPPLSITTNFTTTTNQPDEPRRSIEDPYMARSGQGWTPLAVTLMPKLGADQLSLIPTATSTVTFSYDFLSNQLGGHFWSPGLKYVPPCPGPCLLPTRSYYVLDADFEPYLPREPGAHGAKLAAFFNENPEEVYGDDAAGGFDDVPLFVCNNPWAPGDKHRYIYYGNYSQTRWSDKLDYDHMVEHIPDPVKEYWAEELSATGRAEWISNQLMTHFFPKPEYEGRLFGSLAEGSVAPEEESKVELNVIRDVKGYVKSLKEWEKDARLKTRLIKKDFILQAFERADADEPPGLRLWWEYLQCTKFDKGFYDILATLQARNENYL